MRRREWLTRPKGGGVGCNWSGNNCSIMTLIRSKGHSKCDNQRRMKINAGRAKQSFLFGYSALIENQRQWVVWRCQLSERLLDNAYDRNQRGGQIWWRGVDKMLYSPFDSSNITLRCQSNLLRKMVSCNKISWVSVRSGGFVNCYSVFSSWQWGALDLSINIHFLPIARSRYIHSTDTSIT